MKKITVIFILLNSLFDLNAQQKSSISPFESQKISKSSSFSSLNENSITKSTVLWSDDFSTPTNWVSSNTSIPAHGWEITTFIDTLPYTTFNPFSAPSATNGFALVDATNAIMNTETNTDLTWVGIPIDLTGHSNVMLQFYNATHVFNSTYTVWVSGNNGINWTAFEVNNNLTHTKNPELITLNISSVAGNQSQVLIRFSYEGLSSWFWAIDDVSIVEMDDYDLNFSNLYWGSEGAWGSRIGYYKIPVSQIAPIKFSGIIENKGIQDQSNVGFEVTSSSFSSVGTAATISSSTLDTIQTSLDFIPPSSLINHTFNFGLTSPNPDADLSNNSWASFTTSVTPYDYSRSPQTPTGFVHNNGYGYEVGCIYDFFNPFCITDIKVFIHPNTTIGSEVFATVYSYDSVSGEFIFETSSQPIYTTTFMLNTYVTINLISYIEAHTGKSYLISAGSYGNGGFSDDLVIGTTNNTTRGSNFYYDYTSANWYEMNDVPMISVFSNNICYDNIEENDISGFSVQQNYPNPCTEQTSIQYSIIESGDYTLEVVGVTGKILKTISLNNTTSGEYIFTLDTFELSEGIYFYSLSNGITKITKRMMVQH